MVRIFRQIFKSCRRRPECCSPAKPVQGGGAGKMCILAQLFFSSPTIQGVKCDGHEKTLGELDKCSADEIMSQFTPFEVGPGLEGLSICGDHIEVLTTHNVRKRHKQCDIGKCVNKASRWVKLEQSRRIFTKSGEHVPVHSGICWAHIKEYAGKKEMEVLPVSSELPNEHETIQKGAGLKRKHSQAW